MFPSTQGGYMAVRAGDTMTKVTPGNGGVIGLHKMNARGPVVVLVRGLRLHPPNSIFCHIGFIKAHTWASARSLRRSVCAR